MNIVTLSSQNQITLPVSLGLVPRGRFFVGKQGSKIVLEPIQGSVTDQLAGSLTKYISKDKLGKSWKQIMAETQKIRAKHLANE